MFKIVIILLPLISFGALGEDAVSPIIDNTVTEDMIINKLEQINESSETKFFSQMEEVNNLSRKYIDQKTSLCAGKLSTIDLKSEKDFEGDKDRVKQKIKLTSKEKKLCQYLLVKFRIRFTNAAFRVRRTFVINQQGKQLENLDDLNKEEVKALEKLSHKYK